MPPKFPKRLWFGFALLLIGTGPVVAVIVLAALGLTSDPNPNPIGFGLLAFVTFWPSVALIVGGIVKLKQQRKTAAEPPVLPR